MVSFDVLSAQRGIDPNGINGDLAKRIADAVVEYPLPTQWKAISAACGNTYYWNRVTDQTTWQHPLESVAGELMGAFKDCMAAAGGSPSPAAAQQARERQLAVWAAQFRDDACRELALWRSYAGKAGGPTYYYRAESEASTSTSATTTWEDPRGCLELELRFKTETLASFLGLKLQVVSLQNSGNGASPASERTRRHCTPPRHSAREPDRGVGANRQRPRTASVHLRQAKGGQWFRVEPLPADHSCGFHGLGIRREDAAAALHRHRGDPAVEEFVAADLMAAIQAGERASFPRVLRGDEKLWSSLDAYYQAQQALDTQRREAKELLAEENGGGRPALGSGGEVLEAVRRSFSELKAQASAMNSGPEKLAAMHRLSRYKMEAKALEAATSASSGAEQVLRQRCRELFDEYVAWVGSDSLFWLSFIRSCDGDQGAGGLLDALAKVQGLTVRVWAETSATGGARCRGGSATEEPPLELVHTAAFGPKEIDLWFQGDRGHFDRLVHYDKKGEGATTFF